MNNRLSNEKRAKLEARRKTLLSAIAAMEPGKVSGIVDSVSTENPDIKGVVEKIMKVMDAEPEAAKYHTASNKKQTFMGLLKKAFDMMQKEDESPEVEANDLTDPAMHIFEDAEHEAQSMDDPTLVQEVQKLEEHVKQILNKHDDSRKEEAPAMGAPAPEAPKHSMGGDSEAQGGMSTNDSPEHKLANLKALPKNQRLAKAAKLRALAGVLEEDAQEVSQDNSISQEPANSALMNDYKDQEDGSMKDVQAAKKDIRTLLAALEDMEDDKKDDKKEDEGDKKTALLKLALKHLYASIEDMEKEEDKDDKKEDDNMDKEAGMPPWLEGKEDDKDSDSKDDEDKSDDKEDKKEESYTDKQARIRAMLQKNLHKQATVDGKNMSTPKEVPTATGTTEDTLKGDAKVQYSTNSGADAEEIYTKRTNTEKDPSVLGGEEAAVVYSSNSPTNDRYQATKSEDSSPSVNNKRVLNDGESAVQKSVPSSPTDGMEKGEGSHSKTLDWDSEKSKADMTPSGDRLIGLAEMNKEIQIRTARAAKLAGKMYELGLIQSEAQFAEEIAKLASLDDTGFNAVASMLGNKTASRRVVAEEEKHHDNDGDFDGDDDKDEERMDKEARFTKRASKRRNSGDNDGEVRSLKSVAGQGLRQPLLMDSDSRNYSRKSDIQNRIASAFDGNWTDPVKVANQNLNMLDAKVNGPIDLMNFTKND